MSDINALVEQFMSKLKEQNPSATPDVLQKIESSVRKYLGANLSMASEPGTVDNLYKFILASLNVFYGSNYSKRLADSWFFVSWTPGIEAKNAIASAMCVACLSTRKNEKFAAFVRDLTMRDWNEKMSVWDVICIVPFFFILE